MNKNISREFAQNYDSYTTANQWCSPDVLFELCSTFVQPGCAVLDLGIGTGLSSVPFKNAGANIWGMDNSEHMLEVCASKNLAKELVCHDFAELPLPFPAGFFDVVLANAVFHLAGDFANIFSETKRLIKSGGVFAFTIDEFDRERDEQFSPSAVEGMWQFHNSEHDFFIFKHSAGYVERFCSDAGFAIRETKSFCAFKSEAEQREVQFRAFVLQLLS